MRVCSPGPFFAPHVSGVTCHVSHVMCLVSRVRCHMSSVKCLVLFGALFSLKVFYLVGGWSVIKGACPIKLYIFCLFFFEWHTRQKRWCFILPFWHPGNPTVHPNILLPREFRRLECVSTHIVSCQLYSEEQNIWILLEYFLYTSYVASLSKTLRNCPVMTSCAEGRGS